MADADTRPENYQKRRYDPLADRPRPPVTSPRTRPVAIEKTATAPGSIAVLEQASGYVQFARPGLQRNVVRKLKRGQYYEDQDENKLDLHGYTRFEAREQLEPFIAQAVQRREACVLIIHGKGYHSQDGQGVLRQSTHQWLQEVAAVKAFCSAQPEHGGTGAVYVLLKKRR